MPLEQDGYLRIHAYCPNCHVVRQFSVKTNPISGNVRFLCIWCHWVERHSYEGKLAGSIRRFDRSLNRGEYRVIRDA